MKEVETMNGMDRNFMRRVALGFAMLLLIGTIAERAEAVAVIGVGDVLASVVIPRLRCAAGPPGGPRSPSFRAGNSASRTSRSCW